MFVRAPISTNLRELLREPGVFARAHDEHTYNHRSHVKASDLGKQMTQNLQVHVKACLDADGMCWNTVWLLKVTERNKVLK